MSLASSSRAAAPRLHDGFLASAARWGDRPALLLGARQWTYAEVGSFAHRIATTLASASHSPARVGIFARRSLTSYSAVIGALLTGASFVPLNPTLPTARLQAIISAAGLAAIVTERSLFGTLAGVLGRGAGARLPVVVTDEPDIAIEWHGTGDRHPGGSAPRAPRTDGRDDTAYILFTSGSTGTPKGVPISHANVASFLDTNLARYVPTPDDVFSQTFEQSFDLSIFDIFMAWNSGAALCALTSTELLAPLEVVRSQGITVWFSVPSVVAMQMKLGALEPRTLPSLRLSLFCGEPLPWEYAEAWQQAAPGSVLENLYGPTGLTIACAAHRWDHARSPAECHNGIVPIGRPYDTLRSRVIDGQLRAVAAGQGGELVVAGPQTFAGYWMNPAATEAAFVDLPDGGGSLTRFYRTGDLVRVLPGGDLAFVGRSDQQVKVGGHRIELGEVETALRTLPGVVEAAAYAWPLDGTVAEKLVAVVSGTGLTDSAVRSQLRQLLPAYMVPKAVWLVDEMPRTVSGKLDRRALAATVTELAAGPVDAAAHAG